MSVKLIVVALLATVSVAAGGAAAKVVTVKTCGSDDDCSCAATDTNTKKYTVGTCEKDGADKYWKVDACPAAKTDKIVVKGYTTSGCDAQTKSFPKCKALSYHKATCKKEEGIIFITLITDCTPKDAGCNDEDCCAAAGATGCATAVFSGENYANTCQATNVGEKNYKLVTQLGADCPTESFQFKVFPDADSCLENENEIETITVPATCSARSQKVECETGDASTAGKVSFKICNGDCTDGCSADSTKADIPLKTYTPRGGETLYLESCPATTEETITFEVYTDVKQYTQECETGKKTQATCGEVQTSSTETTSDTTSSSSDTTSSSSDTTTTTSSDTTTTSSSNNSNNSSTSGDGIIAPAHSVGVLAIVLCMLACVY